MVSFPATLEGLIKACDLILIRGTVGKTPGNLPRKCYLANKKRCKGKNIPFLQEISLNLHLMQPECNHERRYWEWKYRDGKCQGPWWHQWTTYLTNPGPVLLTSLLLDFLFREMITSYHLGYFHWGFSANGSLRHPADTSFMSLFPSY